VEVRVALDTNRLTDLFRGDASLADQLGYRDEVWIPLVVFATAEHHARVFVQLKRAGTPIPDNDVWIAAIVLEHNLTLVTRDRHFECIPQILTGGSGLQRGGPSVLC
jgi:predicted nucleic acid-binding protein